MSDDKKFSAKEAAIAVLAKAEQMLKASSLAKLPKHGGIETHRPEGEKGVHAAGFSHGDDQGASESGDAVRQASHNKNLSSPTKRGLMNAAKDEHKSKLAELKAMPKPNLTKSVEPKNELHPEEKMQGEAENPAARIEEQKAPEHNPKEKAEGNNPEWGNEPGNYKLAKFCGHMSAKRKMKSATLDKAEKGLNQQALALSPGGGIKELKGESSVGAKVRQAGRQNDLSPDGKKKVQAEIYHGAKTEAKATLNELKAMPKPNLTKKEDK